MKNRMKKMISLIMVIILLLAAFAGCGNALNGEQKTTPSVNAGANPDDLGSDNDDNEEKEDDPTRVFTLDSLEPLSKEKQAEVEAAWKEKNNGTGALAWCHAGTEIGLLLGDRYYGTFGDSTVIFCGSNLEMLCTIKVADCEFTHGARFNIYVYNNGEFCDITEAYEKKLLSDGNIAELAKYHARFHAYINNVVEGMYNENE